MGVVFRQSINTTAITFFGAALGAAVVLVASNLMPKQELGFSRNLTNQTVVASFFMLMGMANTLFLYFHRFDADAEKERRNVFMSLCFLVPLVVFVLAMIPYFFFQDYLLNRFFQLADRPFMRRYMLCFPMYTLFYLYTSLLEHYLLTQLKSAASSFVREVLLKGLNLVLILLYGFDLINYDVFIYSFVLSNLIAVAILVLLASKNDSFKFSFQWHLFSKAEYKEILSFSGYHALMSISFSLFGFLDAILLASLNPDGLNAVPVYTNAVFISGVMSIPYRSMSGIASADISKSYAQGDHEKVSDSYSRSAINIFIATVFVALLIVCNLHNAVIIMGNGYEAVFGVTLIMMIGKLIDSGTGLNDVALNMSPYFKLNFYFSIGLVLFMLIMFRIFIPVYGIYGTAWVFSISLIIFNLLKTFFVWRRMDLQPFSKGTLTTLFVGVAVLAMVFFLPKLGNPYLDTLYRSSIILILFVAMIFWLKPSKDVSHYVNETLRKKKLF